MSIVGGISVGSPVEVVRPKPQPTMKPSGAITEIQPLSMSASSMIPFTPPKWSMCEWV